MAKKKPQKQTAKILHFPGPRRSVPAFQSPENTFDFSKVKPQKVQCDGCGLVHDGAQCPKCGTEMW